MTRKEEIEKASKIRADQYSHPADWNECYHHFKEGAEWADKTMIEKAVKWLEAHINEYIYIEDFRKAMEE